MVLGDREHVLYGKGYIEDELCGFRFRISPKSFYQVNPVQTESLYNKAIELAGLTGKETVLDAYCGIGTIGITASAHAGQVIGVELNPDAVRDAVQNAKCNNIKNIRFYCNDATKFMTQMAEAGDGVDVVLMDPPRSGSTEEFIRAVASVKAKRVVYVSCGPDTLARDLEVFKKYGYQAKSAWPVDLFPQTYHVETVVLLGRKMVNDKSIEYMHVDYEPEDNEYMRGIKGSATYAEIKAWIKEQYNVSVSSLYIAQCKDECGFEKRQNYNTGAEGHKVPQCPDEKRELIMKAFKHFKMI